MKLIKKRLFQVGIHLFFFTAVAIIASIIDINASVVNNENNFRAESKWIPPEGFPVERYEIIWKRSPFTLSSISGEVGDVSNFALIGYLKIGSMDYITVVNKQSHETFLLSPEPNSQGMRLISVEQNSDPLKVTARVSMNGDIEEIRYDASALSAPLNGGSATPPPSRNHTISVQGVPSSPSVPPHAGHRILRSAPILPPPNSNAP